MNNAVTFVTDLSELSTRFKAVRKRTELMVVGLCEADCQAQSMPDASPVKWHLAHTTWFWETFLLGPFADDYKPFDGSFQFLFNSYYEAVGPRHARPNRGLITRPDLDTVLSYRQHVTNQMLQAFSGGRLAEKEAGLVQLGIAHEEQHQELILTDLAHLMRQNPTRPSVFQERGDVLQSFENRALLEIAEGVYNIGHSDNSFAFDNEGPAHRVFLHPFALATDLVTNGDVVEFINAGGYRTSSLWLSSGMDHVRSTGLEHPEHWVLKDGVWFAHTLAGLVPLVLNAPACHLNYYEADAIARFLGGRLPTEFEWEVAARLSAANPESAGYRAGTSPEPRATIDGGFFGQVWQWTQSAYGAYPGFKTDPGAIGEYNGKFMSGQYVLRGSSCATSPSHSRLTYRNFFPPTAAWQFTGLRLAYDV